MTITGRAQAPVFRHVVSEQQRNAHPTEDHGGSMNPRDSSRGESKVALHPLPQKANLCVREALNLIELSLERPDGKKTGSQLKDTL